MDGETLESIRGRGVEEWLGQLVKHPREDACRPRTVRQVLIRRRSWTNSKLWACRAMRDQVVQTVALLVFPPILKGAREAEQYAYRQSQSALEALQDMHRIANVGHGELVAGDLSNDC